MVLRHNGVMMERKRIDTIPHYDLESLKQGVRQRERNIIAFREAIEKEEAYKAQLLQLIEELEQEK